MMKYFIILTIALFLSSCTMPFGVKKYDFDSTDNTINTATNTIDSDTIAVVESTNTVINDTVEDIKEPVDTVPKPIKPTIKEPTKEEIAAKNYQLGVLYLNDNTINKASEALYNAMKDDHSRALYMAMLLESYIRSGNYELANKVETRFIERYSDLQLPPETDMRIEISSGNYDNVLSKEPTNAIEKVLIASVAILQNDRAKALQILQKELQNKDITVFEKEYYTASEHDYSDINKRLEDVLIQHNEALEAQDESLYIAVANVLLEIDSYQLALKFTNMAIDNKPKYRDAYTLKGYILYRLNDLDNGVIALQEALKIAPEHSKTAYFLALTYEAKGDLSSANNMYQKALLNGFRDRKLILQKQLEIASHNGINSEFAKIYRDSMNAGVPFIQLRNSIITTFTLSTTPDINVLEGLMNDTVARYNTENDAQILRAYSYYKTDNNDIADDIMSKTTPSTLYYMVSGMRYGADCKAYDAYNKAYETLQNTPDMFLENTIKQLSISYKDRC